MNTIDKYKTKYNISDVCQSPDLMEPNIAIDIIRLESDIKEMEQALDKTKNALDWYKQCLLAGQAKNANEMCVSAYCGARDLVELSLIIWGMLDNMSEGLEEPTPTLGDFA